MQMCIDIFPAYHSQGLKLLHAVFFVEESRILFPLMQSLLI